jgi:ketosteroid isomerase-like protein
MAQQPLVPLAAVPRASHSARVSSSRACLFLALGLLLAATVACGSGQEEGNGNGNGPPDAAAAKGAPQAPEAAKAELIALEEDYARALMEKDRAFLDRFYAEDWRGGNWMGFWTRDTMLEAVLSERYVVKSMKVTDLQVRVFGDTAVVQGVDEEVTSVDGRDTSGKWAFTDVFARRGGRWVAVASHTSEVRPGE